MKSFNDYLKEAALSAKQKKIAAVAGDKDKIDAADLTALRAGKKPVEEASCSDKDMKKEELVGKQHKLDKNKNGKLDAHDFKLLRKEESEQIDEGKMKDIYTDMMHHADKKGYSSHKEFTPADYDTVGKQHGISGKELAVIAGHKTAQQADTHFKKPVEPGKGMDRARALAQRGMQSLSKEEVERIEEKLTQIDELSKKTLGSYVKRSANQAIIKSLANPKDDSDDMKTIAKREKGINLATSKLSKEEVEQEMSPYLKGTLKVMDEGKIDNLRDAQKLRQDTQSAYEKDYKPDTSHPHIQVVKGSAYGGANQKDDEGDEKPDDEKQEKKGRGRPAGKVGKYKARGSKSAGDGIDDREYQLHLPNNK